MYIIHKANNMAHRNLIINCFYHKLWYINLLKNIYCIDPDNKSNRDNFRIFFFVLVILRNIECG